MPERKEDETLEVKTNGLLPSEIKISPSGIRKQYLNPDLQHGVSLVAGYDGSNEHVAVVDSTGALKVNAGSASFLNYYATQSSFTSTTPSAANVTLPQYANEIDLKIDDNPINIQLANSQTGTLGDIINLPVGNVEINYVTNALAVWCSVSGSSSTVQVVGWW